MSVNLMIKFPDRLLNGVLEVEATIVATGIKATFVVTRHARDLSEKQLKQAVEHMQALKLHPREETQNRYLLRRANDCIVN